MGERATVVLVDEDGAVLGEAEKLDAHREPGKLHLAFSVVLFRSSGEVLLQQRAASKYHFPGVWANACCSHPRPGEAIVASAEERLLDELGIDCTLEPVGSFVYRARCERTGLVEHELDHVLVGVTSEEPKANPGEVDATCWVDPDALAAGALPGPVAPWLAQAMALATQSRSSGS